MIKPADQQTQALNLDEQPAKKRRGRPATGKAMTPAEKQRAYRQRKNALDAEIKARAKDGNCTELEATRMALDEVCNRLEAAYKEIKRLEKAGKGSKGNVTQKADAVFVLQTKKGNSWKDSEICYFSTMQKAENALMSLGEEGQNKELWRIRQRQFL